MPQTPISTMKWFPVAPGSRPTARISPLHVPPSEAGIKNMAPLYKLMAKQHSLCAATVASMERRGIFDVLLARRSDMRLLHAH